MDVMDGWMWWKDGCGGRMDVVEGWMWWKLKVTSKLSRDRGQK